MISLRVLILDEDALAAEALVRELRRAGLDPGWQRVETEAEFARELEPPPDVILLSQSPPPGEPARLLSLLRERGLDTPVIVVADVVDEEIAIEYLRQGATDYLLKDKLARLAPAVRRALELSERLETVGRVAGGLAHDINNQLMAIMSSCELLSRDLDADHSGQRELREIIRGARRAASLTRRLLTFSRNPVREADALPEDDDLMNAPL